MISGRPGAASPRRERPVIYLVRHGESTWNVARRTQGQVSHPPLSDAGRAQAACAAATVIADLTRRALTASALWSSDLRRAEQTAAVIGAALGLTPRVDPRLRERDLGALQGLGYAEAFEAADQVDWSDADLRLGGGESLREVTDRMAEVITAARRSIRPGAAGVLVGHGEALRCALGWLDGAPPGHQPWVRLGGGAVIAVDARGTHRTLR